MEEICNGKVIGPRAGRIKNALFGKQSLLHTWNQAYLTTTALNNRHVYIDMAALDNVFITIHLVLAKRLMVTHFDMDLNPTVPVRVLKEELVRQLQIPVSQQQWYHRNNFIPDDASLERAGVMNDSIVEVRPAHQSLQRTSDQPSSRFQAP